MATTTTKTTTTVTTTAKSVSPLTSIFAAVADEAGAGTTSSVALKLRNAGVVPEESCQTKVLGNPVVSKVTGASGASGEHIWWLRGVAKHILSNRSDDQLSTCNHFIPNEKSLQFNFKVDCSKSLGKWELCSFNKDDTLKLAYVGLSFGNKRFQWKQSHVFKGGEEDWFNITCSNCIF